MVPFMKNTVTPMEPSFIGVSRTLLGIVLLVGTIDLTLSGCGQSVVSSKPPNVVIVLVDTLRSDHLSAWGYPRSTSPEIEELATTGTKFTRFFSHSAVTRPSVATLFTSRYVSGHGVADQLGRALPDGLPVLAELFDPAVYTRMAFVTNPQIHPQLGFNRGFDDFVALFPKQIDPRAVTPHDLVKVPARAVLTAAATSISEVDGKPFFCYIHLLDPHGPYTPPPEVAARFTNPDYEGKISGSIEDFAFFPTRGIKSGPDFDHFVDLYDAEIFSVDQAIGAFVHQLKNEGLLENTHLLITSDHGEEFMEHGGTGHGIKLYRETVSVPMLWIGPGVPEGRVVDQLTGLVDIAPTIAEAIGYEDPPDSFVGRNLYPLLSAEGARTWNNEVFLEGPGVGTLETEGRTVPLLRRGLLTPEYAVLATGCPLGAGGWQQLEIYDMTIDSLQEQPLILGREELGHATPETLQVLGLYEQVVARILAGTAPTPSAHADLPDEILEQLKSLGYTN